MQIVIENQKFDYDIGCRILKLKYGNDCPLSELADIWDDIKPATFAEIAVLSNLEQRRVGINCMGIERLVAEINPTLIDEQKIKKTTTWVDDDGLLVNRQFEDTYELFEVDGEVFSKGLNHWQKMDNCYYVKCKDTSTDRDYLIWIDPISVYNTKYGNRWDYDISKINALDCISWTIQTNVEEDGIEKIIRQGDCILIKTKPDAKFGNARHLTTNEYKTLLVAES